MGERAGVLASYYLAEALKRSAKQLGERCGRPVIELLSQRLAECIGTPEDDQHSYIWRSAIEDHEQDSHRTASRRYSLTFFAMLRWALLMFPPARQEKRPRVSFCPHTRRSRGLAYTCVESDTATLVVSFGSHSSRIGFLPYLTGTSCSGSLRRRSLGFLRRSAPGS